MSTENPALARRLLAELLGSAFLGAIVTESRGRDLIGGPLVSLVGHVVGQKCQPAGGF
jgi:hypothetical protein